jgi:hypothetical protein
LSREDRDARSAGFRLEQLCYEGKGQAEIAAELSLPAREVRDHVATIRRRLIRIVNATVGAGALSVGLIVVGVRALLPGDDVVVTSQRPPEVAAMEIRKEAEPFCQRSEWEPCLRLLDKAAKLDPAGDKAPEIQKVRERARQQTRDE